MCVSERERETEREIERERGPGRHSVNDSVTPLFRVTEGNGT